MNLAATMTLNASGFTDPLAGVRKDVAGVLGDLGALVGITLSLDGAMRGLKRSLDLGGELNDLSARTGQSVYDLVILRRAFDNAGIGAESLPQILGLLQKSLAGVSEEGQPTTEVFRQLGTTIEELRLLSATEQLSALTRGFARLKDPVQRTAAAMTIFGRSGAQVLQLLGDSNALADAADEAGGLASIMAENAKTFDQVGDQLSVVKVKMAEFGATAAREVLPGLKSLASLLKGIDPAPLLGVVGAIGGLAGTAVAARFAPKIIDGLDNAALEWAVNGKSAWVKALGDRLLPLGGLLSNILPIGLAAAIAVAVGGGIITGIKEAKLSSLLKEDGALEAATQRGATVRKKVAEAVTPEQQAAALKEASDGKARLDAEESSLRFKKMTGRGNSYFTRVSDAQQSPENKLRLDAIQQERAAYEGILRLTKQQLDAALVRARATKDAAYQEANIAAIKKAEMDLDFALAAAARDRLAKELADGEAINKQYRDREELRRNEARDAAVSNALTNFFEPLDEKSSTMNRQGVREARSIEGDRLAKIGLFIGGSGGPAVDYARRTAVGIERLYGLIRSSSIRGSNPIPQAGYS
jgi:hypothetical protein